MINPDAQIGYFIRVWNNTQRNKTKKRGSFSSVWR